MQPRSRAQKPHAILSKRTPQNRRAAQLGKKNIQGDFLHWYSIPRRKHIPMRAAAFHRPVSNPFHVRDVGPTDMGFKTDWIWLDITNINKLALDPKTTTGDTSAETNLAFRTVKDQYKDSPPRHHIRSVAVCRSRVLKRNTPSPGTKQAFLHKTPVETCSALVDTVYSRDLSDVFINQASDPPSLNAKNILLSGSWRDDPFDIHGLVNNPRVSLLLSHRKSSLSFRK